MILNQLDRSERLGATPLPGDRCRFVVWAPTAKYVVVHLHDPDRVVALEPVGQGTFAATVDHVPLGSRYLYRLDDAAERPDPASRCQPDGVHAPSEVIDISFPWTDHSWRGVALGDLVIYELHVGTFTPGGTFASVVPELERLRKLGINAIEVMPVAQVPGSRNWGYDGAYPFAVQTSFGGAQGLQQLVDACHHVGLAVILDVVYNHLGPEGNYLSQFGPYFTDVYHTPWGWAVNFDGPLSDGVRRYFLDNALQWIEDFHVDGLRLDAVHAIVDRSARTFLEELAEAVHDREEKLGRLIHVIAESDLNDPRLVRSPDQGGYGLGAMWCDDLHHAAHALLTGERTGYYADFGEIHHLAKAWAGGLTYTGEYSEYRKRRHGRGFPDVRLEQIVVSMQNHDQIGNRMFGERLGALVSFEAEKLTAGLLVLSPWIPLLFMGQEYGEKAPFQYFVSHGDAALVEAVRNGRKQEFANFGWAEEPPDPQSPETFARCVLHSESRTQGRHRVLYELYRELFVLRRDVRATVRDECVAMEAQRVLFVTRDRRTFMVFYFGDGPAEVMLPVPTDRWERRIDSADGRWGGPGSELPRVLQSPGELTVHLLPYTFCCYTALQDESAANHLFSGATP